MSDPCYICGEPSVGTFCETRLGGGGGVHKPACARHMPGWPRAGREETMSDDEFRQLLMSAADALLRHDRDDHVLRVCRYVLSLTSPPPLTRERVVKAVEGLFSGHDDGFLCVHLANGFVPPLPRSWDRAAVVNHLCRELGVVEG